MYIGMATDAKQEQLARQLAIKAMGPALAKKVVVLDPGHGGQDPGCVGRNGTEEKDITLSICFYLRDMLMQAGAHVVMVREEDRDLADLNPNPRLLTRKSRDMEYRIQLANRNPSGILVSIHCNSTPSPRWYGAQTFYADEEKGKLLANYIQGELIRISQNTSRQALRKDDKYILKNALIPAALVEVGFLSNPREEMLLKNPEYQREIAFAIFGGIARYYLEKGNAVATMD